LGWAAGSAVGARGESVGEVTEPVATKAASAQPGVWSWLESFLPDGIRFAGPAIGSKQQPEVLATAECYNSGAGVSCNGFTNMQEYLAAVHASRNLDIPFGKLKETIQRGKTLDQAIRELRPRANAQIEAWRAEQQAQKALRSLS